MGAGGPEVARHDVAVPKVTPERRRPSAHVRPRGGTATAPEERILSLQGAAGNGAVTSLLQRQATAASEHRRSSRPLDLAVQTKKAPAKAGKPKAKPATPDNDVAFVNAATWLGYSHGKVKELATYALPYLTFGLDPQEGVHLLPHHRKLLIDVASAIRSRNTNEWDAFETWKALEPRLRAEASVVIAKYPKLDPSDLRGALGELDKNGFPETRAYAALKAKTKLANKPRTPDASSLDQLPAAASAFFETKKLYEDTAKLASSVLGTSAELKELAGGKGGLPKGSAVLIEILSSTASLDDKLNEARKKLDVFSAADLINKVMGLSQATMGATSEIGIKYAAKSLAIAEGKQLTKDIGRYTKTLEKFKNLGEMAEKAGKVATVISIAANYAKFVKAIYERKWEDALASGAELGLDVAGVALGGGAAGGAMIAGSVVVVKAQLEAIHLAAEFIRWCKDENVRQASGEFVKYATNLAKWYAWDLIANAEIVLDPDKAAVHHIASQQMEINAKKVAKGLRDLDSLASATTKTAIGGHPRVMAALGHDARQAMAFPADDGLSLVMQLESVFKGVDKMARFVKDNYKN